MIYYKVIQKGLIEGVKELDYAQAHETFTHLAGNYKNKFLFESKDVSHVYGRLSLIGVDPVLKISGKDNRFSVEKLNKRGSFYFKQLTKKDFGICDKIKMEDEKITGEIEKEGNMLEEAERSKQKNIAQVIRILLEKFKIKEKSLLGLYGAFSYDFIRLFENISDKTPPNEINDFTLFLYDTFVFFDHLKSKSEIVVFRNSEKEAEKSIADVTKKIKKPVSGKLKYEITNPKFQLSQKEYEDMVNLAREYTKQGEIFEVVFSNILKAKFKGDPLALYLKYRETNPSPYLFYFDADTEHLIGASPEMMVRCENGIVSLRPISGTARRGNDPIEDHENMLALLSDQKERAELDMLIDLGRNDLSRVCEPGIKITDYRFVEKYSKVMHTVAHLSGVLRKDYTALDALICCLNAGTLTGAPKVAAMEIIEKHEKEKRGYYGGTIGYFTFSGDMDTGIIIRTAHIKNGNLRFQVGATLLYDSVPKKEYQETLNKAEAFLNTFA
ncbi:MAG: anthranilate synthase component I family protein, partial [Candidatus Gracilibacteria bacterium]